MNTTVVDYLEEGKVYKNYYTYIQKVADKELFNGLLDVDEDSETYSVIMIQRNRNYYKKRYILNPVLYDKVGAFNKAQERLGYQGIEEVVKFNNYYKEEFKRYKETTDTSIDDIYFRENMKLKVMIEMLFQPMDVTLYKFSKEGKLSWGNYTLYLDKTKRKLYNFFDPKCSYTEVYTYTALPKDNAVYIKSIAHNIFRWCLIDGSVDIIPLYRGEYILKGKHEYTKKEKWVLEKNYENRYVLTCKGLGEGNRIYDSVKEHYCGTLLNELSKYTNADNIMVDSEIESCFLGECTKILQREVVCKGDLIHAGKMHIKNVSKRWIEENKEMIKEIWSSQIAKELSILEDFSRETMKLLNKGE